MVTTTLRSGDVRYVVSRLPDDVRALLENNSLIILGGGFIRATVAREDPSDIDLFGHDDEFLREHANRLTANRKGSVFHTRNASTVLAAPRLPVQFIMRWLHADATKLIESFDFTVAQAAIWYDGNAWSSVASPNFYADLASRRLVYTCPDRNEDAGGSIMRVRKFISRGYAIHPISLAKVIARLVVGVPALKAVMPEATVAGELTKLLFEVDPNVIIDGLTIREEVEGIE